MKSHHLLKNRCNLRFCIKESQTHKDKYVYSLVNPDFIERHIKPFIYTQYIHIWYNSRKTGRNKKSNTSEIKGSYRGNKVKVHDILKRKHLQKSSSTYNEYRPVKRIGQSIIFESYKIMKQLQQCQSFHLWTSNVCKTHNSEKANVTL